MFQWLYINMLKTKKQISQQQIGNLSKRNRKYKEEPNRNLELKNTVITTTATANPQRLSSTKEWKEQ